MICRSAGSRRPSSGCDSALAFPVVVGGEVVAAVEFYSPHPTPPDNRVLGAVTNVGAVLGRVVERRRAEEVLETQNEHLRQLDSLKDEFVGLVSHELRTPLTSIRGYLDLVLDDREELSENHQKYLEVVERNSKRLLQLVSDLLFVAQVDAGRMSVDREDVDLAAIAAEAVQGAQPHADEQEVRLELHAETTRLSGDPARLSQLVDNLVSNAIKFTSAGGSVVVRTRTTQRGVLLEVADSGIGIPDGRAAASLRALLPHVERPPGRDSGHRARPRDRPGDLGGARRPRVGRERGGRRHDVHRRDAASPARSSCAKSPERPSYLLMVQRQTAGVLSLPAASYARTRTLCTPGFSRLYVLPGQHPFQCLACPACTGT